LPKVHAYAAAARSPGVVGACSAAGAARLYAGERFKDGGQERSAVGYDSPTSSSIFYFTP